MLGAVPKYSDAASGIAGKYPRIAGSCADKESKKNPKTQSPSLGAPYKFGVFAGCIDVVQGKSSVGISPAFFAG
jgi:hypothetical protein